MIGLLCLSIVLSAGRNLLSQQISRADFGTRPFFAAQAALFAAGACTLLAGQTGLSISLETVLFAAVYAALLLTAQWCYTAALQSGQVAICATVYSLGFIFPTMSCMLFWGEPCSPCQIVGIALVVPTIILSGMKGRKAPSALSPGRMAFLLTAMLASGGLGIVQKLQQSAPHASERAAFVLIAFVLAACASLAMAFLRKGEQPRGRDLRFAAGAGICFALCNLFNTILAGALKSAILFPSLNIGSILLSLLLGLVLLRERFTLRHLGVLLLGIASILLICACPASANLL